MRPGGDVLAAGIRRVLGWGGKVSFLLVQQEIRKRVDWGRSRKDCVGSATMQGWKPLEKKNKEKKKEGTQH